MLSTPHFELSTNPAKQISGRLPQDILRNFQYNYRAGLLTPEITVILFTLQLNLPGVRNYVVSS